MSALDRRRTVIGWQTLLADLALILFMVTAAAMSAAPAPTPTPRVTPKAEARPADAQADAPRGEPIAVWRAGGAAPALGAWLRGEGVDPRRQLTISIHYPGGTLATALAEAARLAGEAEAAGVSTRVLVEPGAHEVVATLAYDRMPGGTANLPATGTGVAGKGA